MQIMPDVDRHESATQPTDADYLSILFSILLGRCSKLFCYIKVSRSYIMNTYLPICYHACGRLADEQKKERAKLTFRSLERIFTYYILLSNHSILTNSLVSS